MFALISNDELEQAGQMMVKQLKNRYNDPTMNKKFVIGVDRARMKLFDVEQSAQTLVGQQVEENDEDALESYIKKNKVILMATSRKKRVYSKKLKYTIKILQKRQRTLLASQRERQRIVAVYDFEEDAQKLADFQNKHQVWKYNQGIPNFLCTKEL